MIYKNNKKDVKAYSKNSKDFNWDNFDLKKFFTETDRVGKIIERRNENTDKDKERNGQ